MEPVFNVICLNCNELSVFCSFIYCFLVVMMKSRV